MTAPPGGVIHALLVDHRLVFLSPRPHAGDDPDAWGTDAPGPIEHRGRYVVVPDGATTLIIEQGDGTRHDHYKLKEGVTVPGLPATCTDFVDRDNYPEHDEPEGAVDEVYEPLYESVRVPVARDPLRWSLQAHPADWTIEHPDFIASLTWEAEPRRLVGEGDGWRFPYHGPGMFVGVRVWIAAQLNDLDGVTAYDHSTFSVSVVRPIPGKVERTRRIGATGRKLKGYNERQKTATVRMEPDVPRAVRGDDALDASRKVRAVLADLVALIDAKGPYGCPTCDGTGYVTEVPAHG